MRLIEDCRKGDILTVDRFGRVSVARAGLHAPIGLWAKFRRWFLNPRFLGVSKADVKKGANPWGYVAVFHDGMKLQVPILGKEFKVGDMVSLGQTTNPTMIVTRTVADEGFDKYACIKRNAQLIWNENFMTPKDRPGHPKD